MSNTQTAQEMINQMLAARQQQRDDQQRQQEEYQRQTAEEARQEHRQRLAVFFGEFWPMLEPYAGETMGDTPSDLWTPIDAAPLRLARFFVQPANLRTYSGPGICWGKPSNYDTATNKPEHIAWIFERQRAEYNRQEEQARERAEQAAREEADRQRRKAEQAQELAAWGEAYRAYLIEERQNRIDNAALVDAWNAEHCKPFEIMQIAYPVGAELDSNGEATENTTQHPDGTWIDAHGYRLIVLATGRTERRRYPVILWENEPQTYTPGPAAPYYMQRKQNLPGFKNTAGDVVTLYGPPAEKEIATEAADLIARLRSAQKPADPTTGANFYRLRQQIEAEINGEPADDAGADF